MTCASRERGHALLTTCCQQLRLSCFLCDRTDAGEIRHAAGHVELQHGVASQVRRHAVPAAPPSHASVPSPSACRPLPARSTLVPVRSGLATTATRGSRCSPSMAKQCGWPNPSIQPFATLRQFASPDAWSTISWRCGRRSAAAAPWQVRRKTAAASCCVRCVSVACVGECVAAAVPLGGARQAAGFDTLVSPLRALPIADFCNKICQERTKAAMWRKAHDALGHPYAVANDLP
jgi:hypothetical protein